MSRCRRGVTSLFAALLVALAIAPMARAQGGGVPVIDLDGRGWGHGVGLSQWGARYMAEAGEDHLEILGTFYPGTELASTTASEIRVAVYNATDGRATLSFPDGGQILSSPSGEQAPGFPVDVAPGDAAVVTFDGATYHVSPVVKALAASAPARWQAPSEGGCIPVLGACPPDGGGGTSCGVLGCTGGTTPPTTAPPATEDPPPPSSDEPPTTAPDGGTAPPTTSTSGGDTTAPVWAVPANGGTVGVAERGRRYRGLVEATAGGGPLRLVNQLDVQTYLKGMGEVPGSWPVEAVAAQAVVARTYALRAMSASGELCDSDLCQVYLGADGESAGQSAAVDATAGEILAYAGSLATTVYSADAGGVSATTLEGFGTADDGRYPYLTTVHYDTPNPLPWHDEIALTDVASRLGYGGTIDKVSIASAGPSGRALSVVLSGSQGDAVVDGRQFAASLGLRSTLFTPTVGVADTAPAAPPQAQALQVLPDDTAGMHAAASATSAPAVAAGKAATSGKSAAAKVIPPVPRSVTDLATHPATWAALALLVLATALGLARAGFDDPALALVGSGRRLPSWTLWTRADARAHALATRERMARRRLERELAKAAAVVIPPPSDEPVDEVAAEAAVDQWAPLFETPPQRRRVPLRAIRPR
jgi:stage II sporulation protein D